MKESKYIDIHSHVNFAAYEKDRDEVMRRAQEAETIVINVGTQIDTARRAVDMAEKYPNTYAIVGLHPIHTGKSFHDEKELGPSFAKATGGQGKKGGFSSRGEEFDKDAYRDLLKNPKVVGIGECGLDYYRCDPESIAKQKQAFIAQIELANELNKPLMLHIRNNPENKELNAYQDALEILRKYARVQGNVHFFAGNLKDAQDFIDFGFTLSFTGVITFTNDYDDVIKQTPLEMIMTETDAPYVTPVPHRGKRNEPAYVREVAKRIAEIKGLSESEVASQVAKNAKRVFGL